MIILAVTLGGLATEGIKPVNIYVEAELLFARLKGDGTGYAKTRLTPPAISQANAHAAGYVRALARGLCRYIEEVGSMNVFFVIDDQLVTPALNGSILRDYPSHRDRNWPKP